MKNLLVLLFLLPLSALAQLNGTLILSGKVVGENHEGLVSASIAVKGADKGTITDANGKFALVINQKFPFKVVVSSIGFSPQEIEISSVAVVFTSHGGRWFESIRGERN